MSKNELYALLSARFIFKKSVVIVNNITGKKIQGKELNSYIIKESTDSLEVKIPEENIYIDLTKDRNMVMLFDYSSKKFIDVEYISKNKLKLTDKSAESSYQFSVISA